MHVIHDACGCRGKVGGASGVCAIQWAELNANERRVFVVSPFGDFLCSI